MIVHAEEPQRIAAALAALLRVPRATGPGGACKVGAGLRVLPRSTAASEVDRLLLPIGRPVEDVIEVACAHGFHAEELGRSGIVEFWVDEHMLVELVTSDARSRPTLAA
jgi:hypothetical protein